MLLTFYKRPRSPHFFSHTPTITYFNDARPMNTYNNTIMLSIHTFVVIYTFVKIQKKKVEKNLPCASYRPKTSILPEITPYDYTTFSTNNMTVKNA